jgi:hypothetical protein
VRARAAAARRRAACWPAARDRGTVAAADLACARSGVRREASPSEEGTMAESVYKIIELVGTSTESWEKAAAAAVKRAGKSLRDLRIAEVSKLDLQIENGKVKAYRARLNLSFKYEGS